MTPLVLTIPTHLSAIYNLSGPIHEHGHTLDLVLSHGLSVSNLETCDNAISDHMPVLFEVVFPCAVKSGAPVQTRQIFNSFTAGQFSVSSVSALPLSTQRSSALGLNPPA